MQRLAARTRLGGAVMAQVAAVGLCLPALSGCDAIARLTGNKPTAEQTCSAQSTYDALVGIMGAQLASSASLLGGNQLAARAATATSLKSVLSFSSPTVADDNKTTGKVSCEALLRVAAGPGALGSPAGLSANDVGPDHVTYQISYTVQPTADEGKPLVTLASGQELSSVAFAASLLALKKGDDAVATAAAPDEPPVDSNTATEPEPTDKEAQAASDKANAMDALTNDSDPSTMTVRDNLN